MSRTIGSVGTQRAWALAIAAMALLTAGRALASTSVFYGTLQNVDHEAKTYEVLADAYNYPDRGEGRAVRGNYKTPKLIILDGKVSTPEQALVDGRAVMALEKGNVLMVSSDCMGPDAVMKGTDPLNGIYKIDLGHGAVVAEQKDQHSGEMRTRKYDLRFLIDIVDGKVAGGVALSSRGSRRPYHDADFSNVTVEDGKVRGTVTVKLMLAGKTAEDTIAATYTLEATLDKEGHLKGQMTGSCGETHVKGRVQGLLSPRGTRHNPGKVWLRMRSPAFKQLFAVFDLKDGAAQSGGTHFWHKGGVNGSITRNTVCMDEDGRRLHGTMTSVLTHHGEGEYTIALDASLIGDRWAFGPVTVEHKGETFSGGVRGGFVPATSPFCGMTPELYEQYKAFRKANKNK